MRMAGNAESTRWRIKAIKTQWMTEEALHKHNALRADKAARLEETASGLELAEARENARRDEKSLIAMTAKSGVLLKGSPNEGLLRRIKDAAYSRGIMAYKRKLKADEYRAARRESLFLARQTRRAGKIAETATHVGGATKMMNIGFGTDWSGGGGFA
jgi:hypothetical protein